MTTTSKDFYMKYQLKLIIRQYNEAHIYLSKRKLEEEYKVRGCTNLNKHLKELMLNGRVMRTNKGYFIKTK